MEMTKEVIEVPFEGVAVRKLHDLFERGYTVCGVAIQRIHQSGNFDRGAITTGGMVMWWKKLFSGDELEASNVQHPSNALQLAEALHEMANTYLSTGGDFVPGPRSKADELIDEAASELRRQHARIEDLEAQIYAVGVGGIGQSIKAQQKPVAWIDVKPNPFDPSCRGAASVQDHALPPGEHKLYTAPQPTRQPLTDEELYALYCEAMKGYYVSSLHHWRDAEAHKFARAIEASHGITGGQQ